jgi:hypothetical protein
MAIYECRKCEREEYAPRRYRYHLGPNARCPICGSYRVVKLRSRDRIDSMQTGFLNLLEKIAGKGKLFHCRWCRLQFYDRRPLADPQRIAELMPAPTATAPAATPAEPPDPAPTTDPAAEFPEPKASGPAS